MNGASVHDDNFNLCLEIITLTLFFLGLLFVLAGVVFLFTIVGEEFLNSDDDEWFQARSYMIVYAILTIPVATMILVGVGLRHLFQRPDSAEDSL